jgi:hypothetical protein
MRRMSRKKTSPQVQRADAVRERLDYLYARRTAVTNLIDSLQAYDAFSSRKRAGSLRNYRAIDGALASRAEI